MKKVFAKTLWLLSWAILIVEKTIEYGTLVLPILRATRKWLKTYSEGML